MERSPHEILQANTKNLNSKLKLKNHATDGYGKKYYLLTNNLCSVNISLITKIQIVECGSNVVGIT
ncbi:hypothetical protein NIES2098_51960 [Calothrix sp. NIES-2098]|nr:hypothetical protein NIES2098_51960 [Calothrix sp. NIES-2098]